MASQEAQKSCLFACCCFGKSLQATPCSSWCPSASIATQLGQSPPGSASQPRKQQCRVSSSHLSIIFRVQRVLGSGRKAKGCRRKGCAGRTRAVVTLSDSFQLHGQLLCQGCSWGRLRPACSAPSGGVPARAGGFDQTLMHIHIGWDKSKAAGVSKRRDFSVATKGDGTLLLVGTGRSSQVCRTGSTASCGVHRRSHRIGNSQRPAPVMLPVCLSPWLNPKMVSPLWWGARGMPWG